MVNLFSGLAWLFFCISRVQYSYGSHLDGLDGSSFNCGHSESFPNHRQPRFDPFGWLVSLKTDPRVRQHQRGRIIDGNVARNNAWPWQVSVQLNVSDVMQVGHWCGGVLINPSWVLTAAHCFTNDLLSTLKDLSWSIRFETDRQTKSNPVQIDHIIIHPDYKNYQNDIALLHVSGSLSPLTPVCLPTNHLYKDEKFLGIKCIATGWGQTRLGGGIEDRLHQVELTVVENHHCGLVYGVMNNIHVGKDHLCAGPILSGGKGTCVGDSGGPLHCNMKDGRWYLAGITSFGSGCAKPGFPDVFTRTTSFMNWINDTIHSVR